MIRILHISPSFYPAVAYGGPIFSTKMITDGIAQTDGFEVEVLSTDTADPNTRAKLSVPENPLFLPAGYPVRYCASRPGTSISAELVRRLPAAVARADVVHLTGPYNFPVIPTLLAARAKKTPLVWSPRGGFQATAEWSAAPKRRIKDGFERLCAAIRPKALTFHVTAPVEAETSTRNFPGTPCAIIPNAIEMPVAPPPRQWRPDGRLRLAFLSRVHPKKGLDLLLPALRDLPEHVTLDIFGEGEPDYIAALEQQARDMGIAKRVFFRGPVAGEAKTRAFTECDLFVLPTHSENFGIVVAEAMAHGTPVLTTVNAPWEKLDAEGCGACVAANTPTLVRAIEALADGDLQAMGARGRAWMAREFSAEGMVRQFAALYRGLTEPKV